MKTSGISLWGFTIASLLLISCSGKKFTRETIPELRIEFGYMNQKTGGTNTYILAENGQLFQKSTITDRYTEYKKVREKDAEFIYSTVDQMKQSNNAIYTIGEETHFVRIRKGVDLQEWKWDVNAANLPEDIKKLDALLVKIFEKKID
jgi:predicted transposase YbfD/YdcC